jgi:zinc transport system ATP-binding protein
MSHTAESPGSPPALECVGVGFAYQGSPAPVLENITLRVERGERLGILGPNGGGKSTLLKLALGLLRGNTGSIRVLGMPPEEARKRGLVGYVPQRLDAELGMPMSVREIVTLAAAWRVPPWRAVPRQTGQRVDEMLTLVGASEFADRPAGKLSGGQLQRAMIARALAAGAQMLVLDEPTVGIDAAGQRVFADLLARIHAQLGLTIIIVSHDLRAIVAGSDRVACLARRLHAHATPQGLTPRVLAELFSHEIAGAPGTLSDMHVHAHGANECCTEPAPAVQLGTPARRAAQGESNPP